MKRTLTQRWFMWFIAALFYALDYFQHTAPSVLIQPIATSLQTDIVNIGSIMSLYFPIYALCQIPAGMMLDRYPIKYVLSSACLFISLGLLGINGGTVPLLILGRVTVAIGSAFAFLGALKAASVWLPQRFFGLAVGLTNTTGVVGGLLGQPLLNHLILTYDWKQSLLFISLFGLIVAICIMLFLDYQPKDKENSLPQPTFAIFKQSIQQQTWFIAIYAGIMVGTVVNAFAELYDVVFLQHALRIHSQQASNISAFIFIGIAIGGPLHGIIIRFIHNIRAWMLFCCFLTIITFTTAIFSTLIISNLLLVYILYFLIGFLVSSMLLGFQVVKIQLPPCNHATAFAIINMVIGLCGWLFQYGLGLAIKSFQASQGGALNITVFLDAFWVLLIPLIIGFYFCYKIKLKPINHFQTSSP